MNEYQKKQAACRCLKPERREYIREKMDFSDDFPDGAFLAYMDECGIDVSELETFSIEHDCAKVVVL